MRIVVPGIGNTPLSDEGVRVSEALSEGWRLSPEVETIDGSSSVMEMLVQRGDLELLIADDGERRVCALTVEAPF